MTAKFLHKLSSIIESSEKCPPMSSESIVRLKALVKYTDTRLNLVKDVTKLLKDKATTSTSTSTKMCEEWMKNILRVVGCLASPDNFGVDKFMNDKDPGAGAEATVEENYREFRKRFTELWSEVMKWKMSPSVHKQVVILLPDRIMVHLTKPLHMSHFLLESFKMGGSVGLISLHGIFLLMQKYNFDVPDFYNRLYSMFTYEVLHSKYRARFFAYSRDFLTSTHLPEYLVAAFVKKLSRLSLHAPAPAIPLICDFITNLMIEHPGLKTLVNKKPSNVNEDGSFEGDPFDPDESDPIKSRAMDSCLWELKTLQHHILPSVALSARFISKALPKVEKDLDETFELTYDEIYEKSKLSSASLEPVPTHQIPSFFEEDERGIFMEC